MAELRSNLDYAAVLACEVLLLWCAVFACRQRWIRWACHATIWSLLLKRETNDYGWMQQKVRFVLAAAQQYSCTAAAPGSSTDSERQHQRKKSRNATRIRHHRGSTTPNDITVSTHPTLPCRDQSEQHQQQQQLQQLPAGDAPACTQYQSPLCSHASNLWLVTLPTF